MKRYILIAILLLSSIFVLTYFYFNQLNSHKAANDYALNQITAQSSFIFAFDYDKNSLDILSSQQLLQKFLKTEQVTALDKIQNWSKQISLNNLIQNQTIFLGIVPKNKQENDWIISLLTTADFLDHLKHPLLKNLGNNHFELILDSTKVFVYAQGNFVSLSSNIKLIQNIKNEALSANPFANFIHHQSIFKKSPLARFFIDFNQAYPNFIAQLKSMSQADVPYLFNSTHFAALDYNFSTNQILLTGTHQIDNKANYLKLFENQKPTKGEIINILPTNTKSYQVYSISDFKQWEQDLNLWLAKNKNNNRIDLQAIESKYSLKLDQVFPSYFKNQFITFQLENGEKLGAIALTNGEKVSQLLMDLSNPVDTEISVLKEGNLLYSFFGQPFLRFQKPHYTIIDNFLICSNYANPLQVFLNHYKNDKTLINTPDFQYYLTQISDSNVSLYWENFQKFRSFSIHFNADSKDSKISSSILAIAPEPIEQK